MDSKFLLDVSMGVYNNMRIVRKYGLVPTLNLGTGLRDVWDFGDVAEGNRDYIYDEDGTAPIDTLSSSDALDTGALGVLIIEGLGIDGAQVTQVVQLDGQSKVTLVTPLWRVFRMLSWVNATTPVVGTGFNGKIYCYVNGDITNGVPDDLDTVRAFINDGYNQTLMSLYTIPKGTTGYIVWQRYSIQKKGNASAILEGWNRPYGKQFRIGDSGSLNSVGTSAHAEILPTSNKIPERTDIIVRADVDANDTGISARFDVLLVDNPKEV